MYGSNLKSKRTSRRALSLDNLDVELLADLAMLPNATIIVKVPSVIEVQNGWSQVVHVNDIFLSAIFEVFLVNLYHVVGTGPVWENCNFGFLVIVHVYLLNSMVICSIF